MPLYGKIVIIKRSGQDGTTFPLMTQLCLFGRHPTCDIRVQLPNISKKHCAIIVGEDGAVSVNAYNTTLINNKEVEGRADINHKDIMTISDRSFRFEYPPNSSYRTKTPTKPGNKSTSSLLLGPSLETPKDRISPGPPSSAGRTPRPRLIAGSSKRKLTGQPPLSNPTASAKIKRNSTSPKLGTPRAKTKILKSPKPASVKKYLPRKNVSFGPYLSPERYDLHLPTNTPVKKGTTPRRTSEPPKYFGSPMVSSKPLKSKNRRSFSLATTIEEESQSSSKSTTPSPRLKTPSPRLKTPSPRLKTPSPRLKTPSPKFKTLSPKFKTPSPKFKTPSPKFKTPSPKFKTPSPNFKTPSPKFKTPQSPRLKTPQSPRLKTPQSPRLKTPQSPRLKTPQSPRLKTPQSPRLKTPQSPRLKTPQSPQLKTQSPKLKTQSPKLKTPSPKLKTPSPKLKTPSPKLKTPSSKLKTPSSKLKTSSSKLKTSSSKLKTLTLKTPISKRKSLVAVAKRSSIKARRSSFGVSKQSFDESPSERLFLSSSDTSSPTIKAISSPVRKRSASQRASLKSTPRVTKKTPKQDSEKMTPEVAHQKTPKIPTPSSPDSKKIKALAVIHASKLKKTSSSKKNASTKLFSEVLKKGLAKRTPKVAKKLVKLAVGKRKIPVKKTPGRKLRALKLGTPHHANSPETILIRKNRSRGSGMKTKSNSNNSLSISSFPTPSNITTEVFVSPLESGAKKLGRNKGSMMSRFIKQQEIQRQHVRRKSGPGYTDPSGVQRLLRSPQKAPKPDYSNVSGMKQLFGEGSSKRVISDYSNVSGVEELMRSPETPINSYERVKGVKALLYKAKDSPRSSPSKPDRNSDVKGLLAATNTTLDDSDIAQLFASPSENFTPSRLNSPVKLYQSSTNRRKSGKFSETVVRPIGIAAPMIKSPITSFYNKKGPKSNTEDVGSPSSARSKGRQSMNNSVNHSPIDRERDTRSPASTKKNALASGEISFSGIKNSSHSQSPKKSPSLSPSKFGTSIKKSKSVSPRKSLTPFRNSTTLKRSSPAGKATRTSLGKFTSFLSPEEKKSPSPTTRKSFSKVNTSIISSAKRRSESNFVLQEIVSQVANTVTPVRTSDITKTPKSATRTGSIGKNTSLSTSSSKVIVTQNSDAHEILQKAKSNEPSKLVVLYLVSPENLKEGKIDDPSQSPGRQIHTQGVHTSPKVASPLKKITGRLAKSKEKTSTPKQYKISSLKKLKADADLDSANKSLTPITKSPSPAKKTISRWRELGKDASENDISSIRNSPSPLAKRITRGRKKDISVSGTSKLHNKSPSPVKMGKRQEAALEKSKSPSPVKRVTRGRGKFENGSIHELSNARADIKTSPNLKGRTQASTSPKQKKIFTTNKVGLDTGKEKVTWAEENSIVSVKTSDSPNIRKRGRRPASASPKPKSPSIKRVVRGRGKKVTSGEEDSIASVKTSDSPNIRERGRRQASASPKPKSPSIKRVGRGSGKKVTSRDEDSIASVKTSDSPLRKRGRRQASALPKPKSPSIERVGRGSGKKVTLGDEDYIPSVKTSDSPLRKRGRRQASASPKPKSPSIERVGRGSGKKVTLGDEDYIPSVKMSDSPLRKRGRRQAAASPKPKSPSIERVGHGSGKKVTLGDEDYIPSAKTPDSPNLRKRGRRKVASPPKPKNPPRIGRTRNMDPSFTEDAARSVVTSSDSPNIRKIMSPGKAMKMIDDDFVRAGRPASPAIKPKVKRGRPAKSPKAKSPSPLKKVDVSDEDEDFSPKIRKDKLAIVSPIRTRRGRPANVSKKLQTPSLIKSVKRAATSMADSPNSSAEKPRSPSPMKTKSPSPKKLGRSKKTMASSKSSSPKETKSPSPKKRGRPRIVKASFKSPSPIKRILRKTVQSPKSKSPNILAEGKKNVNSEVPMDLKTRRGRKSSKPQRAEAVPSKPKKKSSKAKASVSKPLKNNLSTIEEDSD